MAKYGGGEVLRKAVSGMLPKNRLRKGRLARLKTFEGEGHPYKANILKVSNGGGQSIADLDAIKTTFKEAKPPAPQA